MPILQANTVATTTLKPHEERLLVELHDLNVRLHRLEEFMRPTNPVWDSLASEDREDLVRQHVGMKIYSDALGSRRRRIAYFFIKANSVTAWGAEVNRITKAHLAEAGGDEADDR